MINPFLLVLPSLRSHNIHEETERELLAIPVENWRPIVVIERRVIDGLQRVLVAMKHGFVLIPFTTMT